MGCGGQGVSKNTIPIGNSLIHLLQTGQTDLIIKRLEQDGKKSLDLRLNLRGDTIAHYACYKNNVILTRYLRDNGADFMVRNDQGESPVDLATDQQVLNIIGVVHNKKKQQKLETAVDSGQTYHRSSQSQANIFAQVAPARVKTQQQFEAGEYSNKKRPKVRKVKRRQESNLTKIIMANLDQNAFKQE